MFLGEFPPLPPDLSVELRPACWSEPRLTENALEILTHGWLEGLAS